MQNSTVIHWFRQDLRLFDNPAIFEAATSNNIILPIYILDNINNTMGEASRVWLHHSLIALNNSLKNNLLLFKGNPIDILDELCNIYKITKIFWNRCYEPWSIKRDINIKEHLQKKGIQVYTYNASLLWEPWEIKKKDNTYYKIFTPFYYRGCQAAKSPRQPLQIPANINFKTNIKKINNIDDLDLLPKINWDKKFNTNWTTGETAANQCLKDFLNNKLSRYKIERDFPAKNAISRLSPYLHFGEISANTIWHSVKQRGDNQNIECFCSELGWREFAYYQLYFNPDLPIKNLKSKFDHFPWKYNHKYLYAWQKGLTGIPIVDAGMRELWQTGFMHNRVRMIVASFLVKNLLIHWHEGAKWFWNCLLDADLANNSASWQWVAGCGTDAAPYFRIFNPITQGQKFDPEGTYIRKYLPEIQNLPNKYLFNPWETPTPILQQLHIKLGITYPYPIVDINESRKEALNAFKIINT